ncbi:GNAT family N-acetyltransferase [Demequina silvatica]|uniref:GNAT family N-acetyltransferase n=1 Tax=Demequina silvatica TaxID=1638988 RepID=UPI001E4867B3|nr:GNAT family N-acetyltransferase [Demequina silvatica]
MAVAPQDSPDVVAYYAWNMASVAIDAVPARVARGVGRHAQPFALLARLAVDTRHESRGLGHALLADVVMRTVELSTRIGCRGLLVHAEDDAALAFYLHALPGFEASPSDPRHLVALVKDLRCTLGA